MFKSTKFLYYSIIQNNKRLRTFSKPMEDQILPVNKEIFEKAVLIKFIRLRDAFDIMITNNNKLGKVNIQLVNLTRLQILTENGSFILQGSAQLSTLFYTSPISGTYKYFYDETQERFYSNKDGHLLDENISRQAQKHFGDILHL